MIIYPMIRHTCGVGFRGWLKVGVEGRDNVPRKGPFIVLVNHQSILDGPILHCYSPRLLFSMTKSTQFKRAYMRGLLRYAGTFPARRYQVDPQSVRVVLRYLKEGRGVGIFPEGERSWDARIQPLRLGTIRLILKAGVPVIPCGVNGLYDFWPRWHRLPRRLPFINRTPVTLRFGEQLHFGQHDDRATREALLDDTMETITAALEGVSGS
jgi:1-acyl-sn-glycerol-3-phosphate acyltransferase